ncbi:hypothetical protein [Salinibacterium sp. M195]|uniref:hypothetical protein n=1 Tax=Salinibacterium sp. M195 TaxID=2583374 RepID=UPI001C62E9DE|nr:hypothetical protein [Salinibacterium sp. M195]QYH35102.1 hypothetical protein FFT87_03560 [Salinibacterium sp. M195]
MNRATYVASGGLVLSIVLFAAVYITAAIKRSQNAIWNSATSEWALALGAWSVWLILLTAALVVLLLAAQIIWAYLPRLWSGR